MCYTGWEGGIPSKTMVNDNTTKEKPKKKIGRPTKFNAEITNEICRRLAAGETLTKICDKSDHMPERTTVYYWLWGKSDEHKKFFNDYAHARLMQAEAWADEGVDIADDDSRDFQPYEMTRTTPKGNTVTEKGVKSDNTAVNRARLKCDVRKFMIAKLNPSKYGDRVETVLSGSVEQKITVDSAPKESRADWEKRVRESLETLVN